MRKVSGHHLAFEIMDVENEKNINFCFQSMDLNDEESVKNVENVGTSRGTLDHGC